MRNLTLLLLLPTILFAPSLWAQKKLPIIKANATRVDIKVDDEMLYNAWTIMPEINPDVYTTSGKKVTFYTDLDSITYDIAKDGQYDFVILLNEKDTAITRIQWEASKLEILQKGKDYNLADYRAVPSYSYQSRDNPKLTKIREDLKLDSIAGEGSELSRIFNLMHWVHNLVRHDGSSDNPTMKNAIDLIKFCQAEQRGVNCRMLAIILNECYLSMGIKSRYVTCMPRETKFDDCHVINTVYSTDLEKWIWIDPTFDAYVMDEKGQLLGLQEVRQRLINNQPLILNADANWNKKNLQRKEYYLDYYMAKNLYRLETPLVSEYDSETWTAGKEVAYVELLPLDAIVQSPQKKVQTNNTTGVKFTYYKTNNPSIFWAKPSVEK